MRHDDDHLVDPVAMLDPDSGLFLDPDTLSRVFDEIAPPWRDTPIITTFGSGYATTVIARSAPVGEISRQP